MSLSITEEVFRRAKEAYEVIRPYIHFTPIEKSATFSRMVGGEVYLKLENLQKTGAFKVRGALHKVWRVKDKVRGVITASAGNHAQGVAYAASIFGLRSVIVMPETASISKVEATKGYGAEVILRGRVYDDAERYAKEVAEKEGLIFIHAFDDIDVIAGQGTIALEFLQQVKNIDVLVVQIGGGGLISGIASVVKRLRPSIKIVGVEPKNAPKTIEALRAGKPVTVSVKPTIADGLLAKRLGDLTYSIISELVDDVVLVTEDEIARAIYLLLERSKVLSEGAGAAGLAALLAGKVDVKGKSVGVIVSGGNIDSTLLSRIIVHEMAIDGRLVSIIGEVYDRPGELKKIVEIIAKHGLNIIDIRHNRWDPGISPIKAVIEVVVEAKSPEIINDVLEELKLLGYVFTVKSHTR